MYKMYIERQRGEEIDRYIDTDIDIYIYLEVYRII